MTLSPNSDSQALSLKDNAILTFLKNTAIDGFWELYPESPFQGFVNDSFYDSLGYSKEEVQINKVTWDSCIASEDLQKAIQLFTNLQKNTPHSSVITLKFIHKNNTFVWMQIQAYLLKDKNENPFSIFVSLVNVTEREQIISEQELKLQHYRHVTIGTDIGTWENNEQTKKVRFNEQWASILGYTLEEIGEIDETTWFKYVHPDDLILAEKLYKEHLNGNSEFYEIETRMKHKDGHWVWVLDKGKVVSYTQDGKPEWIAGSHQDITNRKNIELEVRHLQNLLERSNEVAKIGTWRVDLVNDIITWSKVTRQIHEVDESFQPNIDTAINFFKEGKSRNTITKVFSDCVEKGENYDVEVKIITFQNKEKWVRAVGIPVMEKGICKSVYGLFQDINEKTKATELVYLQEELFRNTFNDISIGLAIVGLDGTWLKVNNGLCNILGYTKKELYTLTFQEITHPEDLTADLEYVLQLLKDKKKGYQMEKRYIHKDGSIIWATLSVTMVKDELNEPLHFIAQITDITERKKSETRINKLHKVTKDQNERLLNFAHIVSHNLRSHASNFTMLLNIIEEETKNNTDTNTEYFPLLRDASSSLNETVKHLNEVVNINLHIKDRLESLNLQDNIQKAIYNIKSSIISTNFKIINEIPNDLYVKAIPAYLESILLNLMTNAIKYRALDREPTLTLKAIVKEQTVTVQFIDNGRGIDLELYGNKIFGMYKTFHYNKDAKGIGLFITKNQIVAMGGDIFVESEVDKGTTFSIIFKA